MDSFLAILQRRAFNGDWESAKPTRREVAQREQEYYERFGAPWGEPARGISGGSGLSGKAMLARIAAIFGALGALALLAK